MSDNFKRYNCIKSGLRQLLPKGLKPNELKMLDHLAKLVNGIIAAGHSQLSKVALKDPRAIKTESKIATLKRLVAQEKFSQELFWLPFVRQFLAGLVKSRTDHAITLVMDGSVVGRGCMALVMSVVYAGRSLPIGWLVVQSQKGHLGQDLHLQLVEAVHSFLPDEAKVTLLGDGEFDGTFLQETARLFGWQWVMRTANNSIYLTPVSKKWCSFKDWSLQPGQMIVRHRIGFSGEGWGPLTAIGVWDTAYKEPIYLISSLWNAQAAADVYRKRYRIETFFSDQKSRGFRLEKSHLSSPERLNRLMIGCVYAYWWLTYLGTYARQTDWDKIVHRTERCDLSFFQLGWRLLEHWQNIAYPFTFQLNLSPQFLF